MFVALVALNDPPRPDCPALLAEQRTLGVHTVMGSAEGQHPVDTTIRAAALATPQIRRFKDHTGGFGGSNPPLSASSLQCTAFSGEMSETAACSRLSRDLKDTGESAVPATDGRKAESLSGPEYFGVLRAIEIFRSHGTRDRSVAGLRPAAD